VDASVWVARLVPRDVHHDASRLWLEAYVARGGSLISPILLLAEVAGAIARRTGDADLGTRAVEQILRVPKIGLVPTDPRLGKLAAQLAADLGLRGADAAYVGLAYHLSVPLVTWDPQQQERASLLVVVHTPDCDDMQGLSWGEHRLNEAMDAEYVLEG
jgi:predicted nucleic acid-binding protein